MTTTQPLARRERARAATIEEIKQTARDLMREQGTTDVRFSDIARQMGLTPPALYRYFADRDDLLTALITDSFDELGAAVAEARDAVPAAAVGDRLLAVAEAYRRWARAEPERFALLFGLPVPGYEAPEEGTTTEAAERAMSQLKAIFFDAAERGELGEPLVTTVGDALRDCVAEKAAAAGTAAGAAGAAGTPRTGEDVPPVMFQAMIQVWTSLHGFVCLEAFGHLCWLGDAAVDELFRSQVQLLARIAGLPAPTA